MLIEKIVSRELKNFKRNYPISSVRCRTLHVCYGPMMVFQTADIQITALGRDSRQGGTFVGSNYYSETEKLCATDKPL
jgi:hypothetical protein